MAGGLDQFHVGILRAYEVLKLFGGSSANRLKALLAFLEPEFAQIDGKIFDPVAFVASVNANMKLSMTLDALSDLIPAIEKQGWLEKIGNSLDGPQYIVRCRKPPTPDPTSARILESLAEEFSKFLDERGVSQQAFPRDKKYLGDCLVDWLLTIDTSDEFTLAAEAMRFDNSSDQVGFFCARFVSEMLRDGSAEVRDLQLIAQVGLLSELVREFKKPFNEAKSTDLKVILDSPILLEILGASGEIIRKAASEVVTRLRSRGAAFFFIEPSINELRHAIQGMLDLPIYERYGPTHAAMQRGEFDEGYIRSVYHNCRDLLTNAKITPLTGDMKARSANPQHVSRQQIEAMARDLEGVYQTQRGSQFRAKHDAEAVGAVMRLRAGEFATNDIFRAKYIFLTRNEAFRNTARAFCLREYGGRPPLMTDEEVGPVVDIKEMASAIFARMPSEQNDDLSRLSLMAGCERVLRLNRRAVGRVSTLVNKMALHASENSEAIRKVRVAMLHPGSCLYIQDRIRGENRNINYDEVLREQQKYEQDNIDKGVAKNRQHYNEQILVLSNTVESVEAELKRVRAENEEKARRLAEKEREAQREREAQAQRGAEEKAAAERREHQERDAVGRSAQRIIASVDSKMDGLRGRVRLSMLGIIALLLSAKFAVEKIFYVSMKFEAWGFEVHYWMIVALLLALVAVLAEASGGILGDVKIPMVRNWMVKKLDEFRDSDREYEEFAANRFGMALRSEGLTLRLVTDRSPEVSGAEQAASEVGAPDGK